MMLFFKKDVAVLLKLYESDEEPSYKELAGMYGDRKKNYPYVHDVINKFRDKGLVSVVESGERNTRSIMLTEKGKEVAEGIEGAKKVI